MLIVTCLIPAASLASELLSEDKHDQTIWTATIFNAKKTNGSFGDTLLFNVDYPDNLKFTSLAIARNLDTYKSFDIEVEGQLVKHYGIEKYSEYTAAILLRWTGFGWDDVVNMSFAFGEGLSYTSRVPEFESEDNKAAARFLNMLIVEATFSLPTIKDWQGVVRIHHRSGVFGLFSGVHGASNALAIGLRYRF